MYSINSWKVKPQLYKSSVAANATATGVTFYDNRIASKYLFLKFCNLKQQKKNFKADMSAYEN